MWTRIDKSKSIVPNTGVYRDWKPQLAEEGGNRCVYCCILEGHFGGIRNFHVEHLRPKSLRTDLENAYGNLFYACAICNVFKSDDWPTDDTTADFSSTFYPDPSFFDYAAFLRLEAETGLVKSDTVTGRYLIERLHLNRAQLIVNRRLIGILHELNAVHAEITTALRQGLVGDRTSAEACADVLDRVHRVMNRLWSAKPYKRADER